MFTGFHEPISLLEPRLRCAHLPPRALGSKTFLLPRREAFVAPAALLHAQVPKALVLRVIPGGSCDPWKNLNQTYQKWEALTTFSPPSPKSDLQNTLCSPSPWSSSWSSSEPHPPSPTPNSEHSEPIHTHPNGPNLWSVHFRIPWRASRFAASGGHTALRRHIPGAQVLASEGQARAERPVLPTGCGHNGERRDPKDPKVG